MSPARGKQNLPAKRTIRANEQATAALAENRQRTGTSCALLFDHALVYKSRIPVQHDRGRDYVGRRTRQQLAGRSEDDDRLKREREYDELKDDLDGRWGDGQPDSDEDR